MKDENKRHEVYYGNNLGVELWRTATESLSRQKSDIGPLQQSEVLKLRDEYGLNTVETGRKRAWYHILFTALCHPFNILLLLLAITSGVTDEVKTMGIMFFMVFLSTILRFHQEFKSEVAAKSLLQFVATKILVIRNDLIECKDVETSVPSTELVPGDWVKLFPGDLVPADVRLLDGKDFHVSQAALTGEAIPVQKYLDYRKSGGGGNNEDQAIPFNESMSRGSSSTTESIQKVLTSSKTKRMNPCCVKIFRYILGMPIYSENSETSSNFDDAEAGRMASDLDKPDMCFMGSAVISGTALCRVIHTGSRTHFGRMATKLAKRRPENAFQLGVRRISWIFFITMLLMIPPVLLLQGFIVGDWWAAFIFALAVAVGLTPEMLPMIVNTTLAKGVVEMSRKHCIVKKLDAIINMGGIDILCTDKTGTLTKSIVTLNRFVNRCGANSSVPLFLGYLNSHFQAVQQNPLDFAITSSFDQIINEFGNPNRKLLVEGLNVTGKFMLVDELPFDFERRRMSVILRKNGQSSKNTVLICKGAVEEILSICTKVLNANYTTNVNLYSLLRQEDDIENITETMTADTLAQLLHLNKDMSADGLRVIAVAYKNLLYKEKVVPSSSSSFQESLETFSYRIEDECNLIFAGFLAFLDPPKDDSKKAIKSLIEHNVNVKVLTGDSPLVCKKICSEIGLQSDKMITGTDLVGISPEKLRKLAEETCIFAKLTPIQKSDIVKALKRNGHIVGFLGDGINDAPALTEADVGISVDSGTDICKESADIILLEKDLTVVVEGVITGRLTYGNTLKYIVMAVSSNFGNVFSILAASAWLPFQPMGSLHILTQNLLYDISQIAIPWDHMDEEFLKVPHRWSMKSVLKFMVMIGPWSSVFDITTFLYMYFYFDIKTTSDDVALFQTAWFTVGLLTQTLIVHMIRTPKIPFVQSLASYPVTIMTVIIMAAGLALPYIPGLNTWLMLTNPLPWQFYPFLFTLLLAYCCAAQFAKYLYLKLFKEWY